MEKDELLKYAGNQLKKIRIQKNLTQEELAERLNTTKQSVGRYESGTRGINQDLLYQLSDIFSVPISFFFPTIETEESISTIYNQLVPERQTRVYNFASRQLNEQKNGVDGKIIPINVKTKKQVVQIVGRLSAGGGAYNDKATIENVEVNSAPSEYDMAFQITGDSMFPTFEDGEVVFVKETQEVFNGQIGAVEINDEAYIKKIYLEGNRMRLVSLNTDLKPDGKRLYPDFYADECDNLFVIGRVIM